MGDTLVECEYIYKKGLLKKALFIGPDSVLYKSSDALDWAKKKGVDEIVSISRIVVHKKTYFNF